MNLIGIDFSITSTAVCIKTEHQYHWFSFPRGFLEKPHTAPFKTHREIQDFVTIQGWEGLRSKDYQKDETLKLKNLSGAIDLIYNTLEPWLNHPFQWALEGLSYGSKGSSFIDLAQWNAIFRWELSKRTGKYPYIVSPSSNKKLIGKGNQNKLDLLYNWKTNPLEDDILEKDPLWLWAKDLNPQKDVPKPIDDLVDSYLLVNWLEKNKD